jgi:hypothetical protein
MSDKNEEIELRLWDSKHRQYLQQIMKFDILQSTISAKNYVMD